MAAHPSKLGRQADASPVYDRAGRKSQKKVLLGVEVGVGEGPNEQAPGSKDRSVDLAVVHTLDVTWKRHGCKAIGEKRGAKGFVAKTV